MSEIDLKKCPIIQWVTIGRPCCECKMPGAEVEFTFSSSGLPENYVRGGRFTRAWHDRCLPKWLKEYWEKDKTSWMEMAMTPPGG